MKREKQWRSAASLEAEVERYFRSISRTVIAAEKDVPILNDDGEPIRYREYVVPPTILGLCEFLGISRETWDDYCEGLSHPEFRRAAVLARERMQDWSQRALLTKKDVRGLIYILQNWPMLPQRPEEERSLSLSQRGALLGEEEE